MNLHFIKLMLNKSLKTDRDNLASVKMRTALPSRRISLILICLLSCVEPYTPPPIANLEKRIVIDGFLDSNLKEVIIKVYVAQSLSDPDSLVAAPLSVVYLQRSDGTQVTVNYSGKGIYNAAVDIDETKAYRIRVVSEGKTYVSDYVQIEKTPQIDSLTYGSDADNLYIYISTHALNDRPRYFRWNFVETWAYRARFKSYLEVIDHTIVERKQDIYHCWWTRPSSLIDLQSTENLTVNEIRRHLLTVIPLNSIKLSSKYSILARQFSVSKAEYQFWSQLASTTENLGTLFDTQPSQVTGNIHTEETEEPVIGYFSAGSSMEMRLTIESNDVPYARRPSSYDDCSNSDFDTIPANQAVTLTEAIKLLYPVVGGYTAAYNSCANCLLFGGTNVKPDFW